MTQNSLLFLLASFSTFWPAGARCVCSRNLSFLIILGRPLAPRQAGQTSSTRPAVQCVCMPISTFFYILAGACVRPPDADAKAVGGVTGVLVAVWPASTRKPSPRARVVTLGGRPSPSRRQGAGGSVCLPAESQHFSTFWPASAPHRAGPLAPHRGGPATRAQCGGWPSRGVSAAENLAFLSILGRSWWCSTGAARAGARREAQGRPMPRQGRW